MNSKEITAGKVVMVGCFDTKAEVFHFLYQQLAGLGCEVISINAGIFGSTDLFPVSYENSWLLESVGSSLGEVIQRGERTHAVALMSEATRKLIGSLSADGQVSGVIGMGGGGGTYIVLNAMQDVPFGIPKICISTLATKDVSHLIGSKDIMLIPSIVDVSGLNGIISVLIARAAVAIAAMAGVPADITENKQRVAVSMFGNTTACVDTCTALLEEKGFEVYAFHANGSGGRAMEELIRGGYFDAVLDVTTTELADDLCGGICSAGPQRGTAAGDMGIPQVVVPGCLDMVNFGSPDTVPEQYSQRQFYHWSPDVTLMRTNQEENRELGRRLVSKIRTSQAPVSIVLPLKGLSRIDSEGSVFYNRSSNEALFDTIEQAAGADIPVIKKDMHINDPDFAGYIVGLLLEHIRNKNTLPALN